MSSNNNRTPKSRITPSASTPIPTTTQQQQQQGHGGPSKLPKFLQKASRDRARSMTDPLAAVTAMGSSASIASSSSSGSGRKGGSRLGGVVKKAAQAQASDSMDEPPVIIEPVPAPTASNPNPRPRTRSERPISDIGHYSPSTPSTTRIGDLPTRLSGWFSHAFSSSSTDLSLPSLLSQSSQLSSSSSNSSPTKTKGSALLSAAARHGSRHLDRAIRYLLDSDAQPDQCADLGVRHPGYEPTGGVPAVVVGGGLGKRRSSVSVDSDGSTGKSWVGRRAPSAYSYRGPPPASTSELSQSQPPSSTSLSSSSPNNSNNNQVITGPRSSTSILNPGSG
jgi:cysteine protease ATG4